MASKASGSLTDVILEAHRKKHLAFLMADLGSLTGIDGPRSGDKQASSSYSDADPTLWQTYSIVLAFFHDILYITLQRIHRRPIVRTDSSSWFGYLLGKVNDWSHD